MRKKLLTLLSPRWRKLLRVARRVLEGDKGIFDRCPVCGSTERFANSVADEQRAKGLFGRDLPFGLWEVGGPVVDPRQKDKILVGTLVPVVIGVIDACKKCGCIYTVRQLRQETPLQAMKPGEPPPPPLARQGGSHLRR